jgi:hypothetical protein
VEFHDGVGVLFGHRLDLDTAFGREHQEMLLGGPIEREAGVVLLVDVGCLLDPEPFDGVPLDVHAEDVAGVCADLVSGVGELDAAGLAAATHLHLGLHHHRVPDALGDGHGIVDLEGDVARAHRDVVAGEVLLALIFEQVHGFVSPLGSRARFPATG